MKYIILDNNDLPVAVLFHELLNHKDVAGSKKVIGAGFCSSEGRVWGVSVGLGIRSKPEDSELVMQAMNFRI